MKKKIIFGFVILALFLVSCESQKYQEIRDNNPKPIIKIEKQSPSLSAEETTNKSIKIESVKKEVKEEAIPIVEVATEPVNQATETRQETTDTISNLQKALEDAKKQLENHQSKTSKLDECTKLCAGEEYDIPYVKDEWYSTCYQIYYYAGESALDEQIADCKK
ncbi:hypothetical protein HYU22_03070 [Candidatus Woesearchaeota archaeon]|nr:hypothetical protein [Candidatus Woesearchaeota archaeon]